MLLLIGIALFLQSGCFCLTYHYFLNQVCTWFIEMAFVWEVGMRVCVCLYLSVCVCLPTGLLKIIHAK